MNLFYELDRDDRITLVSSNWKLSAVASDGVSNINPEDIISRHILDFVSSDDVKIYLGALFLSCRRFNRRIDIPYRCNAPGLERNFIMSLKPRPADGVRVSHIQLSERSLPKSDKIVFIEDHHKAKKCAICCAIKVADERVYPRSTPNDQDFPMGHGICEDCQLEADYRMSDPEGPQPSPLN